MWVVEEYLFHLDHPDAVHDVCRRTSNSFTISMHLNQSVRVTNHISGLIAADNLIIMRTHINFPFEDHEDTVANVIAMINDFVLQVPPFFAKLNRLLDEFIALTLLQHFDSFDDLTELLIKHSIFQIGRQFVKQRILSNIVVDCSVIIQQVLSNLDKEIIGEPHGLFEVI